MDFKEYENKMVKHYWSDCLDPWSGKLLLENVDGSDDFSMIPTNSKGKIDLTVGELRDIVSRTINETRRISYDTLVQ
jgi:hypothetical protein